MGRRQELFLSNCEEGKMSDDNKQPPIQDASTAKKKKRRNKKKPIKVREVEGFEGNVSLDQEALAHAKREFEKGLQNEYQFWKDQPVPQFG